MTTLDTAHSSSMSDEGTRVRARRERLSMGKRELAELAGVSRDTLAAIENGEGFRRSSLTKIEHALDALEDEAGITAPVVASVDEGLIEFDVTGAGGANVVVKGPVANADELRRQVEALIRAMQSGS